MGCLRLLHCHHQAMAEGMDFEACLQRTVNALKDLTCGRCRHGYQIQDAIPPSDAVVKEAQRVATGDCADGDLAAHEAAQDSEVERTPCTRPSKDNDAKAGLFGLTGMEAPEEAVSPTLVRLMNGECLHLDFSQLKDVLEVREAIAVALGLKQHRVRLLSTVRELHDSDVLEGLGCSELTAAIGGFDPNDPETSSSFLRERLTETPYSLPAPVAEKLEELTTSGPNVSRITTARIRREFETQHRPGAEIEMVDDNMFHWRAMVLGPGGTPFENAVFECHILLPIDYPYSTPVVYIATDIFHCNVDAAGWLQGDLVGDFTGWTVASLLLLVISLMADPVLECPANPEAATLYGEDRCAYEHRARECVPQHAMFSL